MREIELEKFVSQKIADNKLDSRYSPLISGVDEVQITEKENLLKELVQKIRDEMTNEFRAKGGKPSGGVQTQIGDDVSGMTQTQFNEYYRALPEDKKKSALDKWMSGQKQ